METQKHTHAEKLFDSVVLASKFGLISGLIGLACRNGDTVFVQPHPREFIGECVVVGLSASLTSWMLGAARGVEMQKILHIMFLVFFVFFVFHVGMEFSGMNNLDTKHINTGDAKTQTWISSHLLNKAMMGIIGGGSIAMLLLTRYNKHSTIVKHKGPLAALAECAMFGLINGAPTALISYDRGVSKKDSAINGLKMSGMYCALYTLLESGGFFSREFKA
jgi:hypothetical protein